MLRFDLQRGACESEGDDLAHKRCTRLGALEAVQT